MGSSDRPRLRAISMKRCELIVPSAAAAPADRRALVHERRERDGPALVDVAEPVVVGNAHVGEEHLVERRAAGHLAQRAHLDAGCLHVDDEAGEALVLGQRRGRCGR